MNMEMTSFAPKLLLFFFFGGGEGGGNMVFPAI